jgi:hypothetical protein
MRKQLALAAVLLFGLSCGGTSAVAVGTAPSPVGVKANATIEISSFHVITQPEGAGRILASFWLIETGGRSGATLGSIRFSDAAGETDDVDDWCWGDSPIRIAPNGSLDASALDYCQPTILTKAPGASATLTVLYYGDNGQQATAVASAPIVQWRKPLRTQ